MSHSVEQKKYGIGDVCYSLLFIHFPRLKENPLPVIRFFKHFQILTLPMELPDEIFSLPFCIILNLKDLSPTSETPLNYYEHALRFLSNMFSG